MQTQSNGTASSDLFERAADVKRQPGRHGDLNHQLRHPSGRIRMHVLDHPPLGGPKRNQIDPATRTFQAIRIAVNNELEEIQLGLNASLKLLAHKGRITAVSFHSLEDRIVKNFIIQNSSMQSNSNRHFPQTSKNKPKLKIISKKPIIPSENEIDANPRSSSAKLRVAEKIEYKIKPSYETA